MHQIREYINQQDILNNLITGAIFIVVLILLSTLSNFIFKRTEKTIRKRKDNGEVLAQSLRSFKTPVIGLTFVLLFNLFSNVIKTGDSIYPLMQKAGYVLFIISIGWIAIQFVKASFHHFQNKLNIDTPDNLSARKRLTQLKMIEKILIVTVVVIFTSVALMSFESIRGLGVSILASAGVVGIVVGLAAQRSVGQILSGIQIALTQPVRIDDIVIVNGELGHIEEINITYSVVKIWDERRIIVPNDYLLNEPIQNWTRSSSNILGTVMLYVSYRLPIDPLRRELEEMIDGNPNWDGRVQNIQVTESKPYHKEIRILLSSANSSQNWDLRVFVRERLIDFINENYPGSFIQPGSTAVQE